MLFLPFCTPWHRSNLFLGFLSLPEAKRIVEKRGGSFCPHLIFNRFLFTAVPEWLLGGKCSVTHWAGSRFYLRCFTRKTLCYYSHVKTEAVVQKKQNWNLSMHGSEESFVTSTQCKGFFLFQGSLILKHLSLALYFFALFPRVLTLQLYFERNSSRLVILVHPQNVAFLTSD